MASISFDELHLYHKIDREIFSQLVIKFMRDPAESLLVMALWLWLEEKGYPNIIIKMMGLSDAIVSALANEAVLCLKCLESNNAPPTAPGGGGGGGGGGIPLTARIMERDISLQMFHQNRFSAISGIKSFLNTVCSRIFTDILHGVFASTSQVILNQQQPLVIPGFPHPLFGDFTILPTPSFPHPLFSDVSILPTPMEYPDLPTATGGIWGWNPTDDVSEDDRTMFLTFSRGFPVLEDEVKEIFNNLFGESCVESVEMETVPSNEQPLYARMVLNSVVAVDRILNGKRISKFRINGKHIWARKYERRDQ